METAAKEVAAVVEETDASFKAAAETINGPEGSEEVADMAFEQYLDQKMEELDEVDAKGLRDILRDLVRSPETFDKQQELVNEIERLEAEGELSPQEANRATRFAKRGDTRRAAAIMKTGSRLVDRIIDKVARGSGDEFEVDQNADEEVVDSSLAEVADSYDLTPGEVLDLLDDHADTEEDQKMDQKLNMDALDESLEDDIESIAEQLDADPEKVASMLGINVPGGEDEETESPEGEEVDQNGEEADQKYVTEDELDSKMETLKEQVVDAVTSEEVIQDISQKMAADEDFQEEIVETVDKKGDFSSSTPTPHQGGSGSGQTIREAVKEGDN